ncbi:MAG: phage head closure protein [Pseudomonadota bacterium]
MKSPRLTRPLELESRVTTPDGAGGFTDAWATLGTLWAEVNARSGTERREAGQAVSSMSYRITVRGAPQGAPSRPRPDQRFRDGTRIFAIRAVAEADPSGRYLTCFADEEVAV